MSCRKVFLLVSLMDVLTCGVLARLGMQEGVWLLNLPATITFGRLASMWGNDAMAFAVTIPAGAAIYGWAGVQLYRGEHSDSRV